MRGDNCASAKLVGVELFCVDRIQYTRPKSSVWLKELKMADNENYREESTNWHLLLGVGAFVLLALLPVVIYVIRLISA